MKSSWKKRTVIVLSVFFMFLIFANFSVWAKEPSKMKVALCLDGPINDGGWNGSAYQGLLKIKEKYGAEIAYSEKVGVADAEAALRDYAARGFDLIIGNAFQWGEAASRIAPQYPKAWFSVNVGIAPAKNISCPNIRYFEGAYLSGMIAGTMTKSNTLGFVSGYAVPDVIAVQEAWKLGALRVNPKAKFLAAYVNEWDNIIKAKEAAIAQFNMGADILQDSFAASGSIGLAQAAQSEGKLMFSLGRMTNLAPGSVIANVIIDLGEVVVWTFEKMIKGELEGKIYSLGTSSGMAGLAGYYPEFEDKIPEKIKAEVEKMRKDILSGKFEVPYITKRTY